MTTPRVPGATFPPREARVRAARLLVAAGYGVAGRATRGDSVYLERPGLAGRIRVSDHRTSPGRRGRLPGPTVSVVIDRSLSERQLAARVAGALADHASAVARTPVASGDGPR